MLVFSNRASAILFNFIKSNELLNTFILPANICPIVPLVFYKAGIKIEFVDIDNDLFINKNIVFEKLKRRKYSGVLFNHSYGNKVTPYSFFKELKNKYPHTLIIDDKCLCYPTFKLTDYCDITLNSTGYAKTVNLGFGGYAYINSKHKYKIFNENYSQGKLLKLQNHLKFTLSNNVAFKYTDLGWLDTSVPNISVEKYFKLVKKEIQEIKMIKQKTNWIYRQKLPSQIQLDRKYQNWRFNILVENKNNILKEIFRKGLFASNHFQSLSNIFTNTNAPFANELHNKIINLFNDNLFNEQMAIDVIEIIKKNI